MNVANKVLRRAQGLVRRFAPAPRVEGAPEIGSVDWLVATEMRYGGYVTNVKRRTVSELDPRGRLAVAWGGMTGGDRMFHHGYGKVYARFLAPLVARRLERLVICEAGILKGSGLALWSELFPNSDVIGLDIDLSHFRDNLSFLKKAGAFPKGEPELFIFDQFKDTSERLGALLDGRKIDCFVDDGFHSRETIINTFAAADPFLRDDFVYFIEDNDDVADALTERFPHRSFQAFGNISVGLPKAD